MGPERRNCARRILYSPEYLDMGADNGGVVVDLSETGLRFQAVGRIEPDSDVALSFSLGTGYRIDAEAHVVWVNPRGNSGGVAFRKLSSDSRSLIREWISRPESEHRVETAVSAADSEPDDSLPTAPPAPLNEAAAGEAQLAASAIQHQPPPKEARLDEVAAPDTLAFRQQPIASSAPTVPPASAVQTAASAPPSANASPPVASPPAAPHASMKEPGMKNAPSAARTSIPPSAATAPVAPSFARPTSVPPQRPAERKHAPRSGASFSVAPSISAWDAKSAAAPLSPNRPNPLKTGAPLFPPRDTGNIFARDRGTGPQLEAEAHPVRKTFFVLLIIGVLIAAALLLITYQHGYRQQIGAAIERVGSAIAGQSDATSASPSTAQPVGQSGNAAAPAGASSTTSPGRVSQPPASAPVTGGSSRPVSPPIPAPSTNFASNSGRTPANSSPAQASKPPSSQTFQTAPTREPVTQASALKQAPSSSVHAGQSGNQQAPKNSATSASAPASAAASQNFGQAQYLRAQQYLNGSGVAPDPAEAAEWFWRSLEAGNTKAALPLADLYLKGEGVSQSCVQARILLDAAVRKGNAEAARKLGQLPENCQ